MVKNQPMMTPPVALPKPTPVLSPIQPCSHLSIIAAVGRLGREWSADSTDVLRVILPTPCWWIYLAVVGLVREQKARCATHETQVLGCLLNIAGLLNVIPWTRCINGLCPC